MGLGTNIALKIAEKRLLFGFNTCCHSLGHWVNPTLMFFGSKSIDYRQCIINTDSILVPIRRKIK